MNFAPDGSITLHYDSDPMPLILACHWGRGEVDGIKLVLVHYVSERTGDAWQARLWFERGEGPGFVRGATGADKSEVGLCYPRVDFAPLLSAGRAGEGRG
jgi:hypothetical protein